VVVIFPFFSCKDTHNAIERPGQEGLVMQAIRTMLKGLTHEDLRDWAGSKIFNRGKDYVSCVSQLSRTEDGT
jgi:hypothetical protein